MPFDAIFEPLVFRNLTVKNRLFRSNMSGRFDNYDGSGNQARINWETRFARGGVGAIVSSFVPVQLRGRIVPNYAMIDDDRHIPFWRAVGDAVHAHDCRFILQLSHAGRQRDINGIEFPKGLSSTAKSDPLHGFECERMTTAEIETTVAAFAEGARRAREAGLDGVELHGANGYLITQFLSSAINDRSDEYGGLAREPCPLRRRDRQGDPAAGRGRLPSPDEDQRHRVRRRRRTVPPRDRRGTPSRTRSRSASGSSTPAWTPFTCRAARFFPHPRNPAGVDLPLEDLAKSYDTLISSGERTFLNFILFRNNSRLVRRQWNRRGGPPDRIEGLNLPDARRIKAAVSVPVICTGGFQTASVIAKAHHRWRLRRGQHGPTADREPGSAARPSPAARIAPTSRAPTATGASSTWSRIRWAATTRRAFRRARRWWPRSCRSSIRRRSGDRVGRPRRVGITRERRPCP